MMTEQKDRHEQHRQHRQQRGNIFQLAPHDHAPFGVSRMMHDCPEKAASAKREEKSKCKQPGIAELMRTHDCADHAQHERDHCSYSEQERKASEAAAFEIFAFRCWDGLYTF